MGGLLFGPAGVPRSAEERSTVAGIARTAGLKLGCMEVQFVQGVKMGPGTAEEVRVAAADAGVVLSAHAPYAINLNSHDALKLEASKLRLLLAARTAAQFGGRNIVFHAAAFQGDPPGDVMSTVKRELGHVLSVLRAEGNTVCLRPELTGKSGQFGSLEELIELCDETPGTLPCIDFAHCHARTGGYNSYNDFMAVLRRIESGLGRPAIESMHIHISGVAYGVHGEQKHLNLQESDLNFVDLLRVLKDYEVKGSVICESPNLEVDAVTLQRTYESFGGRRRLQSERSGEKQSAQ